MGSGKYGKPRDGGGLVRESPREDRSTNTVTATEASRNFSELLNRVLYRGESFVIERGGEPVGELRPAGPSRFTGADLVTLLRSLPPVDEDYLDTVEELTRTQARVPPSPSPWER